MISPVEDVVVCRVHLISNLFSDHCVQTCFVNSLFLA